MAILKDLFIDGVATFRRLLGGTVEKAENDEDGLWLSSSYVRSTSFLVTFDNLQTCYDKATRTLTVPNTTTSIMFYFRSGATKT